MRVKKSNIISLINIVLIIILIVFTRVLDNEIVLISMLTLIGLLVIVQLILHTMLFEKLLLVYLIVLSYFMKVIYSILTLDEFYFKDSIKYKHEIKIITNSNMNIDEIINFIGSIQFGYHIIASFLYKIADIDYILVLINIVLSIISSILFYLIVKKDFGDKVALFTLIFSLFSTNILLFSSHILKDVTVLFFISFSLYLYKNNKTLFAIIIAILLIPIRIYAGIAIILGIIGDILIKKEISGFRKFLLIFITFVIGLFTLSQPISQYFISNISSFLSSYNTIDILISPFDTIFKFYFSPLLWNYSSIDNIYTILLLDSFVMLLLGISLFMFIFKIVIDKTLRSTIIIYFIPVLVHAVALGLEYGGSSDRQRVGVYFILIMFIGIGILYKKTTNLEYKKIEFETE